jgi:hypothetical protein
VVRTLHEILNGTFGENSGSSIKCGQRQLFNAAADRVSAGGVRLLKDLDDRAAPRPMTTPSLTFPAPIRQIQPGKMVVKANQASTAIERPSRTSNPTVAPSLLLLLTAPEGRLRAE